jgi:hypothetical protein
MALPFLPAVIQQELANVVIDPPAPAPLAPAPAKQYIICITKDLSAEDLALFKEFKVVLYNDAIHKNIPIASYPFDILVMDLRLSEDRYTYMKEVEPNRDMYNVIIYCYAFEEDEADEMIPGVDNVLHKFPAQQAVPQTFLRMLLVKRIKKPRCWISLFKCLVNGYHKVKN